VIVMFVFGPPGTTFATPATVTFMLAQADPTATVYWSNDSGGYDALPTNVMTSTASATVAHFSKSFCASRHGGKPSDGGAPSDSGSDAAAASDSGTNGDSGAETDAGSDAGTTDAGATDAGASDGGVLGITGSINNVLTTFAFNVKSSNVNLSPVIQADDSASATHWTIALMFQPGQQVIPAHETCSTSMAYPAVTLQHYTNGTIDLSYSTRNSQGSCTIDYTGGAVVAGQPATGTFSGVVTAVNVQPFSRNLTGFTFDAKF
jgi:hypothetical protein